MPDDRPDPRLLERVSETDPPTARPARPGRVSRVLATLIGLGLLAGIGWAVWFWPAAVPETASSRRPPRPDTVPVVIATAARQDVPIWLEAPGTVQAFQTVTVKPMVDGPLTEMRVREGQDVRAGDVLARIDPRPYQAALDLAVARKAQDEAALENARTEAARYARLAQNNFASAQQADAARARVAELEAQVAQGQAQIDQARTNLSYTTITAPIDGRAGMRLLDQGNIARAADATGLVVLTTLQPISVLFTLPQQTLPAVVAAMRAEMPEVIAFSQGSAIQGEPAQRELDRGRLAVLDNQVDPATGTIKLKATFPNPDRLLWPGGFVNVRLRVATQANALTVPPTAVQRGPRGTFVYVIGADDTARRQAVSVGHEDAQVAVITEGLEQGARVVTDGASRLADGSKVSIVPAAAAPAMNDPVGAPGTRRGRRGG
jgi:multidrug efflux system membrane fusion protein